MLLGNPAKRLRASFQEHLSAGLVFLALGVAVGNRFDGHAIANLSPEGLEFGLDSLTVFLLKSLIRQPLLEAIHGHESYCRFLRRSLRVVRGGDQAMLQPRLAVG